MPIKMMPPAAAAMLGAVALSFSAGTALADDGDKTTFGVSANALAITGFGLSVGMPILDQFNLRLAGNGFSISRDFDGGGSGNSTYNGKVKLLSYGLLADWHPFHGAFRVTSGALRNGNKITLDSVPNGNEIDFGNCSYTTSGSNPLTAQGQTNFRGFAPYAGLGWGGNMNAAPGFFGTFDLGVMFSGSANVALSASGNATVKSGPITQCGAPGMTVSASDPLVQNQVEQDQAKIDDKVDRFRLWPVIGFGLGWRF